MGRIDTFPPPNAPRPERIICTSTTRPVSPWEGLGIYETDTDQRMYWNDSVWVNEDNFRMHACNSPLSGTLPAIDTGSVPFRWQGGTAVMGSSAGGDNTITFPTAFPTGIVACGVIQGDNTHAGATWNCWGASKTGFNIRMFTPTGAVWANSGNFRVNWWAVGW